jgi:hypothetical protein
MSFNCIDCKHFRERYCKYHRKYVDEYDTCPYLESPKEIPLPPGGGYRLAAVAAKKHVCVFEKGKRGPTDPLLRGLRSVLNLPLGSYLKRSGARPGSPLHGAIHIKDAKSGRIVRTLRSDEIERILGRSSR